MSLVTPLKRTAIIVRDMERSLAFYRDVLGLNVWVEGKAGPELPALHQLLGMPPCTTRWVILMSGDVDWGMVGLFELSDPAPEDETHPSIDRVNRGEACLVFHTPDVRRVYRGAKRLGLTVLCPPTKLEIAAHGIVSKEMTLRDPNGVLVNLIQNVKAGIIHATNEFPGLARRPAARRAVPAKRGAAAGTPARRKSAAAGRSRTASSGGARRKRRR